MDTSPVIWLVQRTANPDQAHLIPKVAEYVRKIGLAGDRIAIPAPTLYEFLSGLGSSSARQSSAQFIQANFLAPSFDAKAAAIAADIQADRVRFLAAREAVGSKQTAKIDVTILATAIACGAAELLTNDRHVVKLAEGYPIRVALADSLPAVQPSLPEL